MKQGLDVNHINPFLQSAISIFDSTVQMKMSIGRPCVASLSFDDTVFALQIGVTGDLKGQVIFVMSVDTAKSIASKMMCGMPVAELDEMSKSALGELSNMIMGNTATLFSAKAIKIDITTPLTMVGSKLQISSEVQTLKIPMMYEGAESVSMYICVTKE